MIKGSGLKKATRKLVDSMGAIKQTKESYDDGVVGDGLPNPPSPCSDNCACTTKKTNMSLRGYGFGDGEADGSWFFLLTGFNSKDSVEKFKAGLVEWIKTQNSIKEDQGKEIDELLRKTPASAMPKV